MSRHHRSSVAEAQKSSWRDERSAQGRSMEETCQHAWGWRAEKAPEHENRHEKHCRAAIVIQHGHRSAALVEVQSKYHQRYQTPGNTAQAANYARLSPLFQELQDERLTAWNWVVMMTTSGKIYGPNTIYISPSVLLAQEPPIVPERRHGKSEGK